MFSGIKAINQSESLHGLGEVAKPHGKTQPSKTYPRRVGGCKQRFLRLTLYCCEGRSAFTRQNKSLKEPKPFSLIVLVAGLGVLGRQGSR